MREMKHTRRSIVRVGFDGKVHKHFLGKHAQERFENERSILQYLQFRVCPFVPQVLEADPDHLYLVTTNVGSIVEHISDEKLKALFHELENYGVIHDDPFARNVTYHPRLGRFCVIDFEFATRKDSSQGLTQREVLS